MVQQIQKSVHLLSVCLFVTNYNHYVECKWDKNCPRGFCKDGRCPMMGYERCLEEECHPLTKRCGNSLLCVELSYSCPGEPCDNYTYSCADGRCYNRLYNYEYCLDGSTPCKQYQKRCENSECINKTSRCLEDHCPDEVPYKCGELCLNMSKVCDFEEDCRYGEDEDGCNEGYSYWTRYWLNLIILRALPATFFVAVMIAIVYAFVSAYCCEKEKPPEEPEQPEQVELVA